MLSKEESAKQEMPCPKCKRMHARGEYRTWPPDAKGKRYCCPADVECPCGLVLQHTVPLFAVGRYGWRWTPKPDDRPIRKIADLPEYQS